MTTKLRNAWILLIALGLISFVDPIWSADSIQLERIATGLHQPLLVTHAGDCSNRLFVVEQSGKVLVYVGGRLLDVPFLDLSSEISDGGERGLLGLAFHPNYRDNGFLFVNYTDRRGNTVISRFSVSSNADQVDTASEVELLSIDQPFSNHNGGHLAFGPDGYLYIASGDGGSGGDPQNNGQDRQTLLGKILRIDVDGLPFAIPPDNPFVGQGSARDEIWAWGLRNPWRFSFDRKTGDLFIGDVGQSREEEIDFQRSDSGGGQNYGWRRKEGSLCFDPSSNCGDPGFTEPILVYSHGPHCSVTGGYRYRGKANSAIEGLYVFGDFCSGVIWGAESGSNGVWSAEVLADTRLSITSFGEDEDGELYVVDRGGDIYQIAGSAILQDDFETADTSLWKKTKGNVAIARPGLKGSAHALEATVDATATKSVVISTAPKREQSLAVRFLFNANEVVLEGMEVEVVRLAGTGGSTLARLILEPKGKRYRMSLWALSNSGEEILIGTTNLKKNGTMRLGFEWTRASSGQANDGVARLIKGRRARAERTDLNNGALVVQSLQMGLPAGSRGTGDGTILFDDVLVTR